jgi:hypothetical protein
MKAVAATDAIVLAGLSAVVVGLWLLHPAAALIVGGGFLVLLGVNSRKALVGPRREARR